MSDAGSPGPYPPGWVPSGPSTPAPNTRARWIATIVATVVVVVVGAAVVLTARGTGDAAGSTSALPSAATPNPVAPDSRPTTVASAADTGPLALLTTDVTCGPWDNVQTAVGVAQRRGWSQRDPSVPASAWSPDVRAQYQAVGDALRSGTATAVTLAAQTPSRAMRELYDTFVVYGRLYADALPTYEAPDDALATTSMAALDAITDVCAANRSISAMPQLPDVEPAPAPTALPDVGDPAAPARFLPRGQPNPSCGPWVAATADLRTQIEPWSTVDPGVGVGQWTSQQRAIQDGAARIFAAHADVMQAAGRGSGNAVFEDLATFGATYLRAFVAEEPLYWSGVHDLAEVGLSVDGLLAAACQSAAS
ncbi:hypothetical protein H7K45_16500 [Mycobacterium yunnanensis]|uniref:Uncharacterized protein n=1 Tax=Mycobacterium yunnanensis TaxID=368477 RepID=A0A9X3C316_9MYCO|nr:hypothetical protein [Mycobacterium yunnanensis]MCV7422151.1 hypothetical protein [Mycobacterium yunnanensis]